MTKTAEPPVQMKAAKPPVSLQISGHYNTTYDLWVDNDVTLKQVCDPRYWQHLSGKLRRGDEIKVYPNDMTWRAILLVRAVGHLEVVVQPLDYQALGPNATIAADAPYLVSFVNPDRMWGVYMRDGAMVKDEFQTRELAEHYVKNHMKAMAA
jgi:hypothetical protein